jgi:hypothetical protein
MASTSQQPKGHDGVLTTLDVFIQGLGLAKDTCGIPPAQIAFGTACALLTMIRVRLPFLSDDELSIDVYLGYNVKRPGFHRPWEGLR